MRFPTLSSSTAGISSFFSSGTILHVLGALITLSALLLCTPAQAQTVFTVTNTNDSGAGSLRQAITDANNTPNGGQPDEIPFDIDAQTDPGCDSGTGVCTIAVQSALPSITEAVTVDGEMQTGAECGNDIPSHVLKIVLDGSGAGANVDGLRIFGSGSTVRGLVINQFDENGILLTGSGSINNLVVCNFIGTNISGTVKLGNAEAGVFISAGASNNTIGGSTAGTGNLISGNRRGVYLRDAGTTGNVVQGNFLGTDITGAVGLGNTQEGLRISDGPSNNTLGGTVAGARNIISGNRWGIVIIRNGSAGNLVQGNFVGTDVTGTIALGNLNDGLFIGDGPNNIIGGTAPGAGNIFSGNLTGVGLSGSPGGTTGNLLQGNFIGTDVTGTVDLGNSQGGVTITDGVHGNTIGGTTPGAGNLISGNDDDAMFIGGCGGTCNVTDNVVQGNFIGTDITGIAPLGNDGIGIKISFGASRNTVGGTAAGAGNTIAFNTEEGIIIIDGASTDNVVLGNSIFENDGLGIDLGNDGPTPNDPGDADSSPNHLQNFPDIADAFLVGSDLYVVYRVDSDPANAAYPLTVEFFKADVDSEEGQALLGRVTFTGNDFNSGINKTVILGNVAGVAAGDFLVATATDDDGNTSEFSFGAFEVGSASFALTLKRVYTKPSGKQKAKIKWTPGEINSNKIDFYIAEDPGQPDPTGPHDKRVKTSKKKVKLTVPLGGGGPLYNIQACEKNSTTVCSNVMQADFTNAIIIGPDDADFYDEQDDDAYAGKGTAAEAVPEVFALKGNYPNPFNPTTSIRIDLPERAEVSVVVYDLLGRQVLVVPARILEAGAGRRVELDASHLATGMYLYRVMARTQQAVHLATGQMVLVK